MRIVWKGTSTVASTGRAVAEPIVFMALLQTNTGVLYIGFHHIITLPTVTIGIQLSTDIAVLLESTFKWRSTRHGKKTRKTKGNVVWHGASFREGSWNLDYSRSRCIAESRVASTHHHGRDMAFLIT